LKHLLTQQQITLQVSSKHKQLLTQQQISLQVSSIYYNHSCSPTPPSKKYENSQTLHQVWLPQVSPGELLQFLSNPVDDSSVQHDLFMSVIQTVCDFYCLAGAFYFQLECFITPYILMCVPEFEHGTCFYQFVFVFIVECERQYAEVDQVLAVDSCIVFDQHDPQPEISWCECFVFSARSLSMVVVSNDHMAAILLQFLRLVVICFVISYK